MQNILNYFITYSSFWAAWTFVLLLVLAYGYWLAPRFQSYQNANPLGEIAPQAEKHTVTFRLPDQIALVLFCIFVLVYAYLIFYKSDFAYSDNSQFTFYSLRGRFFGMPIWVVSGRFFPLGLQEYNFIGMLSQSPYVYHGFSVLQLSVVIGGLFAIFNRCRIWFRCLLTVAAMVIPSFVISFFGLIYPERNILFWLVIFLFCYQRFLYTNSRLYLCGVWIAAQFALYYKEPIFAIFVGLAGVRLLFNFIDQKNSEKNISFFRFLNDQIMDVGLLFLSAAFISLYLAKFLPVLGQTESSLEKLTAVETLISYLSANLLIGIFIGIFGLRVVYLCLTKRKPDLIWDGLGFGTLLYFLAFVTLGIFSAYYLAPADFLAILFLGQLAYRLLVETSHQPRLVLLGTTALIATVSLSQNLEQSASHILYRKNIIAGKVELSQFLKAYAEANPINPVSIHFPFPENGFKLMEFSSFLEYKGINLADQRLSGSPDKSIFMVESPEAFEDDLCVQYGRPHKCFYAETFDSDDLVMILPREDEVSPEAVAAIAAESTLLFHYVPELSGLERGLLLLSRTYDHSGSWLNAYVFQKNA